MQQHVDTGIGRALRRARESRGKSLEEVGRETRMRLDHLRAIEREWFGVLGGDVYVRGFLRSYARYLGLNAGKVVDAYEQAYGSGKPAPAPVEQAPTVAPTEALVLTERKRPNWLLAGIAAAILIAAAAAVGVLGETDPVPEPAMLQPPPEQPASGRPVEVGVQAYDDTEITVAVDGREPESHVLEEGDAVGFVGEQQIHVAASDGGRFGLIVNGHRIGRAGEERVPFDRTFTPEDFRGKKTGGDDRSAPASRDA